MELIIAVGIFALIVVWAYLALNKEPDGRHPLESVKNNSELKPMPVLTEEIKIDTPVVESAPVESAVVAPVEEKAEVKEEATEKPKQEKKMATKKPAPAKTPAPAKPAKAPKKPKK